MPVAWKQAQNSRRSSFNNQSLTTRTVQKDGQQGKRSIVHYIKPSKDKHYVPTRLIVVNKGRNRDSTGYIVSPLTILEHDVQRDVELSGEKFSLRIIHIDGDTCSVLQQLAPYLVHVELSDLQLTEVPQGILGRFTTALESLHLDNNKLGDALFNALEGSYRQYHSFRIAKNKNLQLQEVHWLQTLRELSLEYNLICGKLPFNTLRLLSQLQRLYLTGNAISTLQGIDSLHGLRVLGCDYNQLDELHKDLSKLRRLECGYFARNCIIQPVTSAGVLGLVNLRILDISHNGLVTLPGALFKLQVLDSLQASHNKIGVLPNISGGPQLRVRPLSIIDLSNNSVTSIPPAFVKIVNFLDLSYNRIRKVPSAMLKWLSNASQRRGCKPSELFAIDLTGNHIVWPPGEATTDNVDSMVEYYSEKRSEAHAYHGLKVMFFGTSNCGKTSLVTSMSDGQYRYVDSSEESTFGIDIFEIPFDTGSVQLTADRPNALGQTASRRINMSVWDCAGLHCYKQLLAYFSASPLIIVVAIDIEQYALMNQFDENLFHNLIGQWVDLILARSLEALILLVGLKSDRIESKEELMMYLSKMHDDAIRYLNDRRGWLYAEIERLENLSYASSSIKQLYEQLNHIYESARIHVYKPAIPVSCCASAGKSNELGWDSLFHSLTDSMLKHPHILPHFLSPLPPIWSDITDYLEDLSSPQNETASADMGMPLIEKSQLISRIQAKFHVNRADIIVLFRYLHETGRLFIPQLALTREERAYQEAIESTHRPKPQVIIVTNLSLLMNFLKCVLHPSLTACLSQTSDYSVVDTPFPAGFRLELLSNFPLTNREEANRQLDESIKILQRGTGIVCAELWVTLAKYNSMPLGDKNKQNGKYLLELLWRAMELAFPVAFLEQKEDETAGSVHESFNLSQLTPIQVARAAGIYVDTEVTVTSGSGNMDLLANTPTKTADPSAIFGTLGLPALLFPCQIATESPPVTGYNNDLWTKAGALGPRPIRPVYSFPLEFPPGCLERLMVRLNWPEAFQFIYTEIWKTGVQMHHVTHQILIRFGSELSKDGPTIVRFEARALPSVEEPVLRVSDARVSPGVAESIAGLSVQCAESENLPEPMPIKSTRKRRRQRVRWHRWPVPEETVWALLTPILQELEGVLLAYPGLYYNRFLQCPKCNELSFTGEWFAPQDAQSVRYRRCAVCAYKLSTRLLAPPERGQMRMKSTEPHRR